jgi:DNA primase large subunit
VDFIRQIVVKNMSAIASSNGDGFVSVTLPEIVEAIKELETENLVQYVESTQTVIVRAAQ